MGACRSCGEIYGVSDLEDSICKNCLATDYAQTIKKDMQIEKDIKKEPIYKPKFKQKEIVKKYKGKEIQARDAFIRDRKRMQKEGYHVVSEVYVPGQYGALEYIFAILLLFFFIGIFLLFYMLIVKPHGTLVVTYEFRQDKKENIKVCPDCAETVKFAAKKCRFCGYMFSDNK